MDREFYGELMQPVAPEKMYANYADFFKPATLPETPRPLDQAFTDAMTRALRYMREHSTAEWAPFPEIGIKVGKSIDVVIDMNSYDEYGKLLYFVVRPQDGKLPNYYKQHTAEVIEVLGRILGGTKAPLTILYAHWGRTKVVEQRRAHKSLWDRFSWRSPLKAVYNNQSEFHIPPTPHI